MATLTSVNNSGFGGSSFKAPRFDFGGFFTRVAHYFDRISAEQQLAALDDRMLADIGIERADISEVVRGVDSRR
ncbi:MAG: DUF1127 domain-containing protein [Hyphomicrobiales bacterium]